MLRSLLPPLHRHHRHHSPECFGRLALLHPQQVLSQLQQGLGSGSHQTRGVVVGAVKYMVSDKRHPLHEVRKVC